MHESMSSPPLALKRLVLNRLHASELMTVDPISIMQHITVADARTFLLMHGFSAAPVIDSDGRPVGVISLADIARAFPAEMLPKEFSWATYARCRMEFYERADLGCSQPELEALKHEKHEKLEVRDIMTPVVLSVSPDTRAFEVVERMLARRVHRLFVAGPSGKLIGIISTFDILKNLAQEESAS